MTNHPVLCATLELSVEPVWYTAIRPKVGRSASGVGDTETTVAFRFFEDQPWIPALAGPHFTSIISSTLR